MFDSLNAVPSVSIAIASNDKAFCIFQNT